MKDLPKAVINALKSNEYVKREGLSATTLLKPPQMVQLQERYGDDEVEPLNNLWSVFGTAVHNVFEKNAEEDELVEQHYSMPIEGVNVHGTVDHYSNGVISDFKVTSSWKYVAKDFEDWENQLNTYAYLMRDVHPVTMLQIVAIFRDWSAMNALRNKDYPQQQIAVIPIKLWSPEEQYEYIVDKVKAHKSTIGLRDEDLPSCTDKDRWYTGTKWAVMKKGNKRAVKLHDTFEDASSHSMQNSAYYIEERVGENKRCEKYCPVKSKCKQWRKLNEES